MIHSGNQQQLFEKILAQTFGQQMSVDKYTFVSGGCINNTVCIESQRVKYFLKWHNSAPDNMFEAEAKGLELLRKAGTITIPEVFGQGNVDGTDYLIMEYIDSAPKAPQYWQHFGRALAEMHQQSTNSEYGLDHNNYIGRLPQHNEPFDNWIKFFIEKRLEVQLQLAKKKGLIEDSLVEKFRRFYPLLPDLLPEEPASLLHGDMWSGNVMIGSDGMVCLMDPAVYYGNREIEISFTQMFGGFDRSFYDAYYEAFPLQYGFDQRVDIYNLYPYLVHVNLFGPSYLSGVTRVLKRYL